MLQEAVKPGVAKRKRRKTQPETDAKLTFTVRFMNGKQLHVTALPTTPAARLIATVAQHLGVNKHEFNLYTNDGFRLMGSELLSHYNMQDSEIIDCMPVQRGC